MTVLNLSHVHRSFGDVSVLNDVSLTLHRGESIALLGVSGSGKTTLLQMAGLLDTPTSGEVLLMGRSTKVGDRERSHLRRDYLGFVYQFHHLLPEFTALENVSLPERLKGKTSPRAKELLDRFGLSHRLSHYPSQLSGGEQQRVAIARALINRPAVILADEPTGNLDDRTAETVFSVLREATRDEGVAMIIATHDYRLADQMDRTVSVRSGSLF